MHRDDCNLARKLQELYRGEQIERSGKLPPIPEVALKALYKAVCK